MMQYEEYLINPSLSAVLTNTWEIKMFGCNKIKQKIHMDLFRCKEEQKAI